MSLAVMTAGKTDVGLVREKNEDSMLIEPAFGLYAVCDGMGGHVGGQIASQLACATMGEVIRTGNPKPDDDEPDRLVTAIRCANKAVWSRAKGDPQLHNMGTTVVAVRLDNDLLQMCHVGDSRIYRLREGSLEQITRDHSLVNLYQDNPALAQQYGGNPASNVIVRAVGLAERVEVDHRVIAMEARDMYLLCSDGVTDMVEDWMIREILSTGVEDSLDECCEALVRSALSQGGVDNITAVVLRIEEQ